MRIFVTGGTGFVGSPLIEELRNAGHKILLLSRKKGEKGSLCGDLKEPDSFEEAVRAFKPDAAIHLAWEGLPDYSAEMSMQNLEMSSALLRMLARIGCPKVIVTGSCWEYGRGSGKLSEDLEPIIEKPFTAAKHALHLVGRELAREQEMTFIWARLFFVYGKGQRSGSVIPYVLRCLEEGKPVMVKTPDAKNDFIHAKDVASALRILVEKGESGTYNVGSGKSTAVREVVRLLHEAQGKKREEPIPRKDSTDFFADMSKLSTLGWKPRISLKQGLGMLCQQKESGRLPDK